MSIMGSERREEVSDFKQNNTNLSIMPLHLRIAYPQLKSAAFLGVVDILQNFCFASYNVHECSNKMRSLTLVVPVCLHYEEVHTLHATDLDLLGSTGRRNICVKLRLFVHHSLSIRVSWALLRKEVSCCDVKWRLICFLFMSHSRHLRSQEHFSLLPPLQSEPRGIHRGHHSLSHRNVSSSNQNISSCFVTRFIHTLFLQPRIVSPDGFRGRRKGRISSHLSCNECFNLCGPAFILWRTCSIFLAAESGLTFPLWVHRAVLCRAYSLGIGEHCKDTIYIYLYAHQSCSLFVFFLTVPAGL